MVAINNCYAAKIIRSWFVCNAAVRPSGPVYTHVQNINQIKIKKRKSPEVISINLTVIKVHHFYDFLF